MHTCMLLSWTHAHVRAFANANAHGHSHSHVHAHVAGVCASARPIHVRMIHVPQEIKNKAAGEANTVREKQLAADAAEAQEAEAKAAAVRNLMLGLRSR